MPMGGALFHPLHHARRSRAPDQGREPAHDGARRSARRGEVHAGESLLRWRPSGSACSGTRSLDDARGLDRTRGVVRVRQEGVAEPSRGQGNSAASSCAISARSSWRTSMCQPSAGCIGLSKATSAPTPARAAKAGIQASNAARATPGLRSGEGSGFLLSRE